MKPIFAPGLFDNQVVVITGGGSGIGLCVAEEVGQLGARVAICGRKPEKLESGAQYLRQQGIEVHAATCDTRKPELVDSWVDQVLNSYGRIDVLVNNAGGQFPMMAEHLDLKGFEAVVRNNLFGTWNFTSSVAKRAMIGQKSGQVVNVIAQIARGFPGMLHTGAARAAVDNMTKSLAVEWTKYGIRVNAVAPGVIRTSGTTQYPPALLEMGRKATPLKRLGKSEEVAHLIAFLASSAAGFITGQTFYIDGGQSLWGDIFSIPDDIPGSEPVSPPSKR